MRTIQLKINNYYFFFLTHLFCVTFLSISSHNNTNEKESLNKFLKILDQAESISMYFTINIKEDTLLKISKNINGQIDIKGNKFHLKIPNTEIWFDGINQWILHKKLKEINVINQLSEQNIFNLNPLSFLKKLKKDCKYKKNGEIELILQHSSNQNINKIRIQINHNNFMPIKIHIFFANKTENIIYIKKYIKNIQFSDSYFFFNKKKYPNTEIIDLR